MVELSEVAEPERSAGIDIGEGLAAEHEVGESGEAREERPGASFAEADREAADLGSERLGRSDSCELRVAVAAVVHGRERAVVAAGAQEQVGDLEAREAIARSGVQRRVDVYEEAAGRELRDRLVKGRMAQLLRVANDQRLVAERDSSTSCRDRLEVRTERVLQDDEAAFRARVGPLARREMMTRLPADVVVPAQWLDSRRAGRGLAGTWRR